MRRIWRARVAAGFGVAWLAASGCRRANDLDRARELETLGRYPKALESYEEILRAQPPSPSAAEALFRRGEIYRTVLRDPESARAAYERILKAHPGTRWASAAKTALLNNPDYFPFVRRVLISGDAQSGGANMRLETSVIPYPQDPFRARVTQKTYAGDSLVGEESFTYEKRDRELRALRSNRLESTVLVRTPALRGARWETFRDGEKVTAEIEETAATVRAGSQTYAQCLKVKEVPARSPQAARIFYYAPFVGPVLVSASGAARETPLVELLEVRAVPDPGRPRSGLRSWWAGRFGRKK